MPVILCPADGAPGCITGSSAEVDGKTVSPNNVTLVEPCLNAGTDNITDPSSRHDRKTVPSATSASATCALDAGTDGTTVPASRDDGNIVPSTTVASALVQPQHANPFEQATPMPEVIGSGQASAAGKRAAFRDTSSLPEAGARAKAKAKVVPKPKGGRRRLQNVPSNPESRIATINSIRDARNHPYLPPEPKAPDD